MNWLLNALILFAVAGAGGATLFVIGTRAENWARWLRMVHGGIGLIGLTCLIIAVSGGEVNAVVIVSLLIFLVVAGGGLMMWVLSLRGNRPPLWLMLGHAVLAMGGFAMLLLSYFALQSSRVAIAGM